MGLVTAVMDNPTNKTTYEVMQLQRCNVHAHTFKEPTQFACSRLDLVVRSDWTVWSIYFRIAAVSHGGFLVPTWVARNIQAGSLRR